MLLNQGKAWIYLSGFIFLLLSALIHLVGAWMWMQQRNPTELLVRMEMDACFRANWICTDFRRQNSLSSPEEQDLDVSFLPNIPISISCWKVLSGGHARGCRLLQVRCGLWNTHFSSLYDSVICFPILFQTAYFSLLVNDFPISNTLCFWNYLGDAHLIALCPFHLGVNSDMESDLPKRESFCSLQLNIYLCLFWCALSLVFPSPLRHHYQFPLILQTLPSSRRVTQHCFGRIFCYLTANIFVFVLLRSISGQLWTISSWS